MGEHVGDELAAYLEQQVDSAARARIARHLRACETCRAKLDRVRDGLSLAADLRKEAMPADVAERIRRAMAAVPSIAPVMSTRRGRAGWWPAAAAVLLLAAGVGGYWQTNRPWVRLHAAAAAPTRFEHDGRDLHDRLAAGAAAVTLRSSDEGALWAWLDAQGAPVTSMRIGRPDAERAQFEPLGAMVQTLGGARTSVLSYRIDGRPVTLALALSRDVADAPAAGWWTKRVMHRRDANGVNTLTWTVGGGTYVMVSELDGAGQRACLICHTAPAFRERLRGLDRARSAPAVDPAPR